MEDDLGALEGLGGHMGEQNMGEQEQGTEQDVSKGGDGSVKKTILKKGSGWKMPTELDEVTIYYEGTLEDGTKFASTGKPFTFNVGQGQVIKSLDEAVPTMKKGERAKIVTSPSHAYGEQGSPPTIPPNAKLFIEVELVHWRTVTDLTGDGGVVKKVLEEGQGFDKPRGMDEVTLKYSVRAAETGSQLFTTGDDGQEMTLPSISNSGLKALVESMKKGEVADASFHRIHGGQNYVEGLKGAENVKDEAWVHVQLLSWKKVDYVADTGEKVLKKVIEEGEGFEKPNDGAKVKISYAMWIAGLEDGEPMDGEEELEFTVDEDEVLPGLDRAVVAMKKKERAVVSVDPEYGLGKEMAVTSKGVEVPGGSTLVADMRLLEFEKDKESYQLESNEKVEAAKRKKDDGNSKLKNGKVAKASKRYSQGIRLVEYEGALKDEDKREARQVKLQLHLNAALAHLKLKQPREALKSCDKALEIESANLKGLFRRAQALAQLEDYDEADLELRKVLNYDPENKEALQERRRLQRLLSQQRKQDSKLYGGMFKRDIYKDASPPPASSSYEEADKGKAKAADSEEGNNDKFDEEASR